MGEQVSLEMLRRAAFYQQIVGEAVTLFHLALLGLLGWLYLRWKQRQLPKVAAAPSLVSEHKCMTCGARIVVPYRRGVPSGAEAAALAHASGWGDFNCPLCVPRVGAV
jgi:hypothetical protein